jgi:hypothetical protein
VVISPYTRPGEHPEWGLPGCSPTKPPKTEIKKKTDLVDIMISNVLRDLLFSRNQLLISANGYYIRILKNKLIKLKKEDSTL